MDARIASIDVGKINGSNLARIWKARINWWLMLQPSFHPLFYGGLHETAILGTLRAPFLRQRHLTALSGGENKEKKKKCGEDGNLHCVLLNR